VFIGQPSKSQAKPTHGSRRGSSIAAPPHFAFAMLERQLGIGEAHAIRRFSRL
jgi:hypothetical protein